MKEQFFEFQSLPYYFTLLESDLAGLRFEGPGIWPLCELSEPELNNYFSGLHQLAHECLAMHLRCDAPAIGHFVSFADAPLENLDYRRLIQLTRELLFCCDINLIYEYRIPTGVEYEMIRLLEQTHAQLIGAHYGQRPGEETLDAHELIFI